MQLILEEVRLSFPKYLFKAGTDFENQTPRFSCDFLFEKGGVDEKKVNEVIVAAAKEKWKEKADEILKVLRMDGKICVQDGDHPKRSKYDGYAEHFVIKASAPANKPPRVVDRNRDAEGKYKELREEDGRPYGGCYVRAVLDLWAQDNKWGKRINCTLKGVQFIKDGDAFSASTPAQDEDFADISDTGDDEDFSQFCG